jgi:N-acetylneuraminate epimerase
MLSAQSPVRLDWAALLPLPDRHGFAGSFAGLHNEVLLVGGGANFPDKMPWEGGTKVWHATVFALSKSDMPWKAVGELPRPLAYGVSLSTKRGIVCLGGSDSQKHYSECFLLEWVDGKLKTTFLPPLPRACANMCGALLGNNLLVAGGLETPTATTASKWFWSMDLSEPQPRWLSLEAWPGPERMLSVCSVLGDTFYLMSGVSLTADPQGKPIRTYLQDAYAYRSDLGWNPIADLPRPAVAAPTPAPSFGNSSFLILGGDAGTHVNSQSPESHPGFERSILRYDTEALTWTVMGELPAGQVTTGVVKWNDQIIIPSGEIRPGVRTPKVWAGLLK